MCRMLAENSKKEGASQDDVECLGQKVLFVAFDIANEDLQGRFCNQAECDK